MPGIRIAHRTLRSCVALVPLVHKPLKVTADDVCPTCRVVHQVKTVHLWLDSSGSCIVSEGVLADLRRAGMPQLMVEGEVKKPPRLVFGPGAKNPSRAQVDNDNRRVQMWTPRPFKPKEISN